MEKNTTTDSAAPITGETIVNPIAASPAKSRFAPDLILKFVWASIVVVSFVFYGSISYPVLAALLVVLAVMYHIDKKKSTAKYPRPSFLLLSLVVLTVAMNAPLFFPGFVKMEKDGFYAYYDDGSSGYADDNVNHCINCTNPIFVSLAKNQTFFITGYSYDSTLGGTNRNLTTRIGSFDMYNVENNFGAKPDISLTTSIFLVKTFFILQSIVGWIFLPLSFM